MGLEKNCREKIAESKFFLDLMKEKMDKPKEFGYCLSAFLMAVRAPFQYAIGEFEKPPKNTVLKTWYEGKIGASSVLKFFRDERNLEIHVEPRRPKGKVSGKIPSEFGGGEGVVLGLPDSTTGEMPKMGVYKGNPVIINESHNIEWSYTFVAASGTGTQDVLTLSEICVNEVEATIDEGVANGLIIA